jgi:hypothetical protein
VLQHGLATGSGKADTLPVFLPAGAGTIVNTTTAKGDGSGTAVSSFVAGPCGHTPTKWGYQCGFDTQQGVHLYWSVDIPPPFNPCTGVPSATGEYANQIHFLAEMWLPQVRHISVTAQPKQPGRSWLNSSSSSQTQCTGHTQQWHVVTNDAEWICSLGCCRCAAGVSCKQTLCHPQAEHTLLQPGAEPLRSLSLTAGSDT